MEDKEKLAISASLSLLKSVVVNNKNAYDITSNKLKNILKLLKCSVVVDNKIAKKYSEKNFKTICNIISDQFSLVGRQANSAFYQSFADVNNRSELVLRLEQLLNYATVYTPEGYQGEKGRAFIPNDNPSDAVEIKDSLTAIKAVTISELAKRLQSLLAGSALSEDQLDNIFHLIDFYKPNIDFSQIKNRQAILKLTAKQWLTSKKGYMPESFDLQTRLILAVLTDGQETQILNKSEKQRSNIIFAAKHNPEKITAAVNALFAAIFTGHEKYLAHVIQQKRKFYLLLKNALDKENRHRLNRTLHWSQKRQIKHVPAPVSPADRIMETDSPVEVLTKVNNYKLIKIINYLMQKPWEMEQRYFIIRNGSSWLTNVYMNDNDLKHFSGNKDYSYKNSKADWLLKQARQILTKRIAPKFKDAIILTDSFPQGAGDNINKIALPSSGKTMVGSIPQMTTITIDSPIVLLGTSWEQKADVDLHASTLSGENIGWNNDYKSNGATFSGDMTALNKYGYAAEYIRLDARKIGSPIILREDLYYSDDDNPIKTNLLLASVDKNDLVNSDIDLEMVKPKNEKQIITKVDKNAVFVKGIKVSYGQRSRSLAIAYPLNQNGHHWKIVIYGQNFGNSAVLSNNMSHSLLRTLTNECDHFYSLNDLLADTAKLVPLLISTSPEDVKKWQASKYKTGKVYDFRLRRLTPDTLTGLLADN